MAGRSIRTTTFLRLSAYWHPERKDMNINRTLVLLALSATIALGGCKKKVAPPAPPTPPPPAPAAPTASISVSPGSILPGGTASLTWQTTNATDVAIEGIGTVDPDGTQPVSPTESTTYILTAKGPGGSEQASTRLTVSVPPPPPAPTVSEEELFAQNIKDVYFDFDAFGIRLDQQTLVQADATFLSQHKNIELLIEGHCDERGSAEYNLSLGDSRAESVKDALVSSGIAAERIRTISLGKERPFCTEEDESCWQQNRRGHFVYQRETPASPGGTD